VSRYQKGKTNLDFTGARDSEWQWHQLGHMQVCTSLQKDNHASTSLLSFFTGRMPFLPPNQQRQSTEGAKVHWQTEKKIKNFQHLVCGVYYTFGLRQKLETGLSERYSDPLYHNQATSLVAHLFEPLNYTSWLVYIY